MADDRSVQPLWEALDALARDLDASSFRLPVPGRERHEATRLGIVATVRHSIAPRLVAPDAPIVVAVAGPSGAGTSAVVNALADDDISPTGSLRPTTRRPILFVDGAPPTRWWTDLVGRFGGSEAADVVVAPDEAPASLVLLDAPAAVGADELVRLVDMADLCVFVTSPARYADAMAAAVLGAIHDRGVPLLHVMNRLPADDVTASELVEAYAERLQSWGLVTGPDPDIVIPLPTGDGSPGAAVAGTLGREIVRLGDPVQRDEYLLEAMRRRALAVADATADVAGRLENERGVMAEYGTIAFGAYRNQKDRLERELGEGAFAELARHSEWSQVAVDLSGILTRRAGLAAQDATEAWGDHEVGAAILRGGGGGLRRHGRDMALESQGLLEMWIDELGEIAGSATKRQRAGARRRARLARRAWPLVMDGGHRAHRSLVRALGDRLDDVVDEGRRRLVATLGAALDRDAARFSSFLGSTADPSRIGRLFSAVDLLREAAPRAATIGEFAPPGDVEQAAVEWTEPYMIDLDHLSEPDNGEAGPETEPSPAREPETGRPSEVPGA